MNVPIRIHPDNAKVFEYRGKPRLLVCATEHYGAVMNRPFKYEKYLADHAENNMTLSRLFVLYRELQTTVNPYSTCKPESPDYIAPFLRVGPDKARDGQPKYDLEQWNPEFFARLHGFLGLASTYGIIVEVVLFSNNYCEEIWALNPLHDQNNINGLPKIPCVDYLSMRHPQVFERQVQHVRKLVEEVNRYDNVFFEICNEPAGNYAAPAGAPTAEDVDAWQSAIAECIRETEKHLPCRHLVAGQEAFDCKPYTQGVDKACRNLPLDIVNIHPSACVTHDGKTYDMGQFMAKELKLRAVRDFCLAAGRMTKPLNLDEDNAASQYKDYDGWTIHRKRAWVTLMSMCQYDYIDFSIINYCETGTAESRKYIRSWMKYLAEFVHSIDLVAAKPLSGFLRRQPEHTVEAVLAVAGKDYCIYLADERELTESGHGEPIRGTIGFELPPGGAWQMSVYSPQTGLYSPGITIRGGVVSMQTPAFVHDIAFRFQRT